MSKKNNMENSKEFKPKAEDEIRNEVLTELKEMDYNLDDANLKPLIDKMVNKEIERQNERIEAHKNLSKAIGQKKKRDDLLADRDKKLAELLASKAEDDDDPDDKKAKPEPKKETIDEAPKDNEKLSALEQKVSVMEQQALRRQYAHLEDEEFNAINSLAKAEGKSFEDTMSNNPLAKTYLETNKVSERIASATANPSSRVSPNANMSPENIDLNNPEHIKYLKEDPKRMEEYDAYMEKGGFKNLNNK